MILVTSFALPLGENEVGSGLFVKEDRICNAYNTSILMS